MSEPLELLYRDDRLVAINKPAGLLVHRSEIDRHETRFAVQLLRDQIGQRVWPVHRLDKGTSGVLLFALHAGLANSLTQSLLESGRKTYLAVTRGYLPAAGIIDKPLRDPWDAHGDRDRRIDGPERPAETHYRCLAHAELPIALDRYPTSRYSLAELTLLSGRRHQIRRHLKALSHPVIGDSTYGKGNHNRLFQQQFDCHRLLLHASRLEFMNPESGQRHRIEAPLDAAYLRVLQALDGWLTAWLLSRDH